MIRLVLIKIANILFNHSFFLYKQLYFLFKRYNEREEIKLLYEKIKPGMTAIDIGGNIGFYTILLSKIVGNNGRVYVFEPDPVNYHYLILNTKGLKNVYLNNYAVGAKTGKIKLYSSDGLNWCHQTYDSGENRKFKEIECIAIDDYLKNDEKIDFIKIDIEGYDYYAFWGMKETIKRSNEVMLLGEFHPYFLKEAGVNPEDFLLLLKNMNFHIKFFNSSKINDYKLKINDKHFYMDFYGFKRVLEK